MPLPDNPVRSTNPEDGRVVLLCTGADGADLTVSEGKGATVVRDGEGSYYVKLLWNPGTFKGWGFALWAATPGDLKGYSVVRDTPVAWSGTDWRLPFTVYNASVTAADLIANQGIDLELRFGLND